MAMADDDDDVGRMEEDLEEPAEAVDEEGLITYYFFRGLKYDEIRLFLSKFHDVDVSLSTLKRRIKQFGLKRRKVDYNLAVVTDSVRALLNGPDSHAGYRAIWHSLQMNGHRVPRLVVEEVVRELDPDGVAERASHRLKRRVYRNPGPNHHGTMMAMIGTILSHRI